MKDINEIKKEIASSKTIHELLNVKASLIGKSGTVTEEFKNMKDLSIEEKKAKGLELNQIKNEIEALVEARMKSFVLMKLIKLLKAKSMKSFFRKYFQPSGY